MTAISIRPEQTGDAPAIAEINELAFGRPVEAQLVAALRESTDFIPPLSLVAETAGQLVGHVLFSRAQLIGDGPATLILTLGPLAVRPTHQRQGIGTALVRHGLAEARRLGYPLAVLIGHPTYYPRFGFVPARAQGLTTTLTVSDPVFMVVELQPGALGRLRGQVRFAPAFDSVS